MDNGFLLSDFTDRYEFIRKLNGTGEAASPDSPFVLKTDGTKAYWSDGGGLGDSLWQLSDTDTGEENENALSGNALVYDMATEKWKNRDLYYHDGYYFPNAVQDYDDNWYGAVIIGNQVWMAENLRTTKYYYPTDGEIHSLTRKTSVDIAENGLYYYVATDTPSLNISIKERGYFYTQTVCTAAYRLLRDTKWDIPSVNAVDKLIEYLNTNHRHLCGDIQGNIACALACDNDNYYWAGSNVPNTPGYPVSNRPGRYHNNSSGFNAYPVAWENSTDRYAASFRLYDNEYSQPNISLIINYSYVDVTTGGIWSMDSPASLRYLYGGTPEEFVNQYVNAHGTMQYTGLWQLSDVAVDYSYDDIPVSGLGGKPLVYNRLANAWYGEDLCYHDGYYFPNAIQDLDGNWYGAVVIGEQVWMAENLRTTYDGDGNPLTPYDSYNDFINAGATKRYLNITDPNIPLTASGYLYDRLTAINIAGSGEFSDWRVPGAYSGQTGAGKLFNYLNRQAKYLNDGVEEPLKYCVTKAISSKEYWDGDYYNVTGCPSHLPEENNKSGFNAVPFFYNTVANFLPETPVGICRKGFQIWTNSYSADATPGCYVYIRGVANEYYTTCNLYEAAYQEPKSVRFVYNGTVDQFRDWYIKKYGSMQHHIGGGGGGDAGTLTTTSASGLATQTNEPLSGSINLHKISKTGDYNDLRNLPTIPTISARTSDFDALGYYAGGINIGGAQTDFIVNPARPVFLNSGDYVLENQGVVRPLFEVNRSGCDADIEALRELDGGVICTPTQSTQICANLEFSKGDVTLLPIVCVYRKNPLLSTRKGGDYRYESIPCVAIPTALYENAEFGFNMIYASSDLLGFPACTPK